MAKFVTLPRHNNMSPVTVNVDKICVISETTTRLSGTLLTLDCELELEINMPLDEVIVLVNKLAD